MKEFKIKERMIGEGHPVYIIAEMSANHAKSLERAKEIIRKAKECGVDCIKIQTYTPDTLTIDCKKEWFQVKNGTWEGENLYQLYEKAYTPWEWQRELKEEADRVGIDFFSTPFDESAVDFLEEIGCEFYKVASFEMVHLPLLRYIARTKKPIIMSTGMSTKGEIKEAVEAILEEGNQQIVLLNCTSAYPATPADMNLRTMVDMKESFHTAVGLSDHSLGDEVTMVAVSLGASVIEKHFCMGREIDNPDASFSMTPTEMKEMVERIRSVEQILGNVQYGVANQEEDSVTFRRSLFAVKDIEKGERFSEENIRIIRPGYGIQPKYMEDLIGMVADVKILYGTPIQFTQLPKGAILFLSNNQNTDELYDWLVKQEECVLRFSHKISLEMVEILQPSFIVSFNYRHLISKSIIEYMGEHIINLHTSYLPYNRGSNPNFFSFYDNTPKGVTIHRMEEGLDTGDILVQKECLFEESKESFETTYECLIREISQLFYEHWNGIKRGEVIPVPQTGQATYHTKKELVAIQEKVPFQWSEKIEVVCKRLHSKGNG